MWLPVPSNEMQMAKELTPELTEAEKYDIWRNILVETANVGIVRGVLDPIRLMLKDDDFVTRLRFE